jgi:hypothetical protein
VAEPDEEGVRYRFKFLDNAQVARDQRAHWFTVPKILGIANGPEMMEALMDAGLKDEALKNAYKVLDQLHRKRRPDPIFTRLI